MASECKNHLQGGKSEYLIVSFDTHADKLCVESGRPWLFDGHIFILESYNGNTKSKDMKFN